MLSTLLLDELTGFSVMYSDRIEQDIFISYDFHNLVSCF